MQGDVGNDASDIIEEKEHQSHPHLLPSNK